MNPGYNYRIVSLLVTSTLSCSSFQSLGGVPDIINVCLFDHASYYPLKISAPLVYDHDHISWSWYLGSSPYHPHFSCGNTPIIRLTPTHKNQMIQLYDLSEQQPTSFKLKLLDMNKIALML